MVALYYNPLYINLVCITTLMTEDSGNVTSELAYDLRQKWVEIVGQILERIIIDKFNRNFVGWYEGLSYLHSQIDRKLADSERGEYKTELIKCIEILNQYSAVYLGASKDMKLVPIVHDALNELEIWLYRAMEEHHMFGSKEEVEGLF